MRWAEDLLLMSRMFRGTVNESIPIVHNYLEVDENSFETQKLPQKNSKQETLQCRWNLLVKLLYASNMQKILNQLSELQPHDVIRKAKENIFRNQNESPLQQQVFSGCTLLGELLNSLMFSNAQGSIATIFSHDIQEVLI